MAVNNVPYLNSPRLCGFIHQPFILPVNVYTYYSSDKNIKLQASWLKSSRNQNTDEEDSPHSDIKQKFLLQKYNTVTLLKQRRFLNPVLII